MLSEFIRNHLRAIIITILIIFAGIIAYATYINIAHAGKVAVTVGIVPSDATATANGQKISPGTTYLAPGEYKIEVSKDGFESYSQSQTINDSQTYIVASLAPQSDEANQWAKDHQQDYLNNEELGGASANQYGTAYSKKYPIVGLLPYSNYIYTIGYQNDPSDPTNQTLLLTIDAAQGSRNAAVEQIRSLGFDPTDYNIKIRDYTNPFTS